MKRGAEELNEQPEKKLKQDEPIMAKNRQETDLLFNKIKALHNINLEIFERISSKKEDAIILFYSYDVNSNFDISETKWERQASSLISTWAPKKPLIPMDEDTSIFPLPIVKGLDDLLPLNETLLKISTYLSKFGSSEEGPKTMRTLLANIETVQEYLGELEAPLLEPESRLEEYKENFNLKKYKEEMHSQVLARAFPLCRPEEAKEQLRLKFECNDYKTFEQAISEQLSEIREKCNREVNGLGLFHWLGHRNGDFENPVTNGMLKVTTSHNLCDNSKPEFIVTDSYDEELVWFDERAYVIFDLGPEKALRCRGYVITPGADGSVPTPLRSVKFEASKDGQNWTKLHQTKYPVHSSFYLRPGAVPHLDEFFRFFRFRLKSAPKKVNAWESHDWDDDYSGMPYEDPYDDYRDPYSEEEPEAPEPSLPLHEIRLCKLDIWGTLCFV